MLPVPNGLAPEVAALTAPMAVAWHAVRRPRRPRGPREDPHRPRQSGDGARGRLIAGPGYAARKA